MSITCNQARLFLLISLAPITLALFGCRQTALTIDQVIERNTDAMGGRIAIEAVKSLEVESHISDPGFEVDGIYRAARPGRMRIDVQAGGKHVFTEAFDGERGWQWKGSGEPVEAGPKAAAALRHGLELPGKLFGLHELKGRGNRIELVGRETLDAINYYVLRLTLSDGYNTSLYVDPQSWLVTRRRDIRPLHVDVDPTPTVIEQRMSDFRQIAGVQFAFISSETDLKTGKLLENARVKRITVNPTLDQSIFGKL
jgi:hypothetical protein